MCQGISCWNRLCGRNYRRSCTNRIEFLTEFLDASHFSDKEHFQVFQDYLGKKYAGQKLDLILAFPSRDYRLAGELPKALFPDVPVVFVAVNEMEVPEPLHKLGVTGIVQRFDIRGTLGLIMRLQPDTRRIVVIGGVSDVDRATLGRITEASRALEGVEFDFWTNRPAVELPGALKSLPEGTVVLVSTMINDVNGQTFYMSQLAQVVASSASVPVYVLGGWVLGSGAVGGSVVDSEDLGARAAQLAVRVLNGANPEKLPIEVATKGTPMVDWRALERWDIKQSRLPADCVIRYRPHSVWEATSGIDCVCRGGLAGAGDHHRGVAGATEAAPPGGTGNSTTADGTGACGQGFDGGTIGLGANP